MLENIRYKMAQALMPRKTTSDNRLNMWPQMSGNPIYTDLTISKAIREGYKMSLYVYRSVRTIVQAGSGIPWIVLDKNGEYIPGHEFEQVWARPNPQFSGQDNMEFIIAHLKLGGNALIQPLIVNGRPKEFWVCMPDMLKPVPSKNPMEWLEGYEITLQGGGTKLVPPDFFIHFMQFDPGNPYWGIGDLKAAGRTIDTDNEAQDTQKVSMQNRGVPSGVFQFDETLTNEQYEDTVRRVREKFLQKSKRAEPWVLGGGYKWTQMSLTPVEMDYISSRTANKQDIAAAFGLDPWWLGDKTSSTYNNVSEARKALYETTIIPLLEDIKGTLNQRIAPMYGDVTITYDISNVAALREDYGKKVEQAQRLWAMGIPFEQINEKLEMGFDEFLGWENGYLPFSVLPMGQGRIEEEPKYKANYTDEFKTAEWKRIDGRRMRWAEVLEKKIEPLYKELGKAVADNQDKVSTAVSSQKPKWIKMLKAAYFAIIEDMGKQLEEGKSFDPFSEYVRRWVEKHAAEGVMTILATQKDAMAALIKQGIEANLSNSEIARSIRDFYTDNASFLAMRVARTESTAAAGYGQHQSAREIGYNNKTWVSSRDDRTRDAHAAIDGEEKEINEAYSNGLMYPGDTSGDPGEFINCRCVEVYSR